MEAAVEAHFGLQYLSSPARFIVTRNLRETFKNRMTEQDCINHQSIRWYQDVNSLCHVSLSTEARMDDLYILYPVSEEST